jgi:hypothetical protein
MESSRERNEDVSYAFDWKIVESTYNQHGTPLVIEYVEEV